MGGRGSTSGIPKTLKFKASVANLSGSDKQKKWAQNIINDALNTINANIELITYGRGKGQSGAEEKVELYKSVAQKIIEQVHNAKSASQIIDSREGIDPDVIVRWVDQQMLVKEKRRRRNI